MMKRRRLLITGMLLLLGGAIVNVAVAWGCAMLQFQSQPSPFPENAFHRVNGLFGPLPPRSRTFLLGRFAFGFPIRSMEYYERSASTIERVQTWEYGSAMWVQNQGRFLPLGVAWPGFAINTIFYAAILWLLFFAPGSVRRTIRRRRGLCPACTYPIGTSPVCTECGSPLLRASEGEGLGVRERAEVIVDSSNPHPDPLPSKGEGMERTR